MYKHLAFKLIALTLALGLTAGSAIAQTTSKDAEAQAAALAAKLKEMYPGRPFGAVAPTPVRAPQTEKALEGQRLDEATIEKVANIARDEVKPIDDVRATAWYRKEMIHNITKRILSHVAQA